MREVIGMVVSLLVICLLSAFALSKVYSITKPQIDRQVVEATEMGLKQVLPQAERFEEVETSKVWLGFDNHNRIGIVFKVAPRGYGGPIPTFVGVDLEKKVTGVKICVEEGLKETPGLGLQVIESWFGDQFKGKTTEEIILKKHGGKIEAITAATISSKAMTAGIREGIEKYLHYLKEEDSQSTLGGLFKDLLPAVRFEEVETSEVWLGYDSLNNRIGMVFKIAPQGYCAPIEALVGVDSLINITEIKILSCEETQGIGDKITTPDFLDRFKAKGLKEIDKVEAITGATISANALINGVKEGMKKYRKYLK